MKYKFSPLFSFPVEKYFLFLESLLTHTEISIQFSTKKKNYSIQNLFYSKPIQTTFLYRIKVYRSSKYILQKPLLSHFKHLCIYFHKRISGEVSDLQLHFSAKNILRNWINWAIGEAILCLLLFIHFCLFAVILVVLFFENGCGLRNKRG